MSELGIRSIQELQRLVPGWSRQAIDLVSLLGGPAGWMAVVVLTFWWSGSRLGTRVALLTCVAALANVYLKWWILAPRPIFVSDAVRPLAVSDGLGMPSGHAQGAATQWGALAWWGRARWRWPLAIAMVLGAGLCRVYYGLHSPAQVLAGWLLGVGTVVAGVRLEAHLRGGLGGVRPLRLAVLLVLAAAALAGIGLAIEARTPPGSIPESWEQHFHAAAQALGRSESEFLPIDRSDLAGAVGGLVGALAVLGYYGRHPPFAALGVRRRVWVTVVGAAVLLPCTGVVRVLGPLLGEWSKLLLYPAVLWVLAVGVPRWADRLDPS